MALSSEEGAPSALPLICLHSETIKVAWISRSLNPRASLLRSPGCSVPCGVDTPDCTFVPCGYFVPVNYQLSFLFIFICLSFIKLSNFAALDGTLFRTPAPLPWFTKLQQGSSTQAHTSSSNDEFVGSCKWTRRAGAGQAVSDSELGAWTSPTPPAHCLASPQLAPGQLN